MYERYLVDLNLHPHEECSEQTESSLKAEAMSLVFLASHPRHPTPDSH